MRNSLESDNSKAFSEPGFAQEEGKDTYFRTLSYMCICDIYFLFVYVIFLYYMLFQYVFLVCFI